MDNFKLKIQKLFKTDTKAGQVVFVVFVLLLYWTIVWIIPALIMNHFTFVWDMEAIRKTNVDFFQKFLNAIFEFPRFYWAGLSELGYSIVRFHINYYIIYFFVVVPLLIFAPIWLIQKILSKRLTGFFVFFGFILPALYIYIYIMSNINFRGF